MTKNEIINLFRSKGFVLPIGGGIKVFSYSQDDDPNAIWYISFFNPDRVILIPNDYTEEFLDELKPIILDIVKIRDLTCRVNFGLNEINSKGNIRSRKITNLLNNE